MRKGERMPPVTSPGVRPVELPTVAVGDRRAELHRIRFRRAVTLLVMTLLMPGSAQLVAGNKRVGRVAVRIWLGCLTTGLLTLALGYFWRGFAFWLAFDGFASGFLRTVLTLLAIGWALLLIDAWRLGQPLGLAQRQRLVLVGLNGVTVFAVAGSLLFASHLLAVKSEFIGAVFGNGPASAAEHGRFNVLLVGGDKGAGRWGLRTDSMTVASVDEETGKTVLFGLPRNMTNFPFPEGTPLAEAYPDGYDCDECTLNSLATWAADHQDEFKGSANPGIDATIMGVEGITGLKINYYALVDMAAFEGLVDAMGGLTLNVRDRIPVEFPAERWIEPGVRKLDGYETLWFARARETADDYSRMARQKCVMSAMLQQISPQDVLMKFEEFAAAGEALVETDLPASELDTFAELALKARSQKLATVSFVPPTINTSDPDLDKIREMVDIAVDRSEGDGDGSDESGDRAGGGPRKGFSHRGGTSTGGSLGSLSDGYVANQTEDLSKAC
jgi:polyisoprenyl-teichoic acid--peptidoglycan teichoic acid transferase